MAQGAFYRVEAKELSFCLNCGVKILKTWASKVLGGAANQERRKMKFILRHLASKQRRTAFHFVLFQLDFMTIKLVEWAYYPT